MQLTVFLRVLIRIVPVIFLGMVARPLTFHPAPGSESTKHLASEWTAHLDEIEIVVNGQEWRTGYTVDTRLAQSITITDTYGKLQGGRPIALDREFDAISQDLEVTLSGDERIHVWENVRGTSELEGTVVQFRAEEGESTRRFDPLDRDLDHELLDGLTEDMDLRALLPKEPVAVGDEWEIDLSSLPDVLSPGGYFAWSIESEGAVHLLSDALDPALMGDLRHVLGAMLEGHATVRYVDELDGYSQLAISMEIECTNDVEDLAGVATRIVDEMADWGTIELERLDWALTLKAIGTAQWDTERGQIFDLELTGDVESAMDLVVNWDIGSEFRIEVRTVVSGEFEQSFETQ